MTDRPIARVLAALPGAKRAGENWAARCPAHEDRIASLSIREGTDGRVLLNCHAGCTPSAIVGALALDMRDLFPAREMPASGPTLTLERSATERPVLVKTYDYVDADGTLLYQACRFEPKTFRQRRPDGAGGWTWNLDGVTRVLYRLPEVVEAVALGQRVWLVEGEKDADAIVQEGGGCATTWVGGAKAWRDEYATLFRGAEVVCLPDHDEPGHEAMQRAAASLTAAGATVRVVELPDLPPKGDASDWLDAGGDWDALDELVRRTPIWSSDPASRTCWRLDELLADETIMRPPLPVVPRLAWRGRSTLLAAQEKAGKSTLVGYLAAAVSRGTPFCGDPCQSGRVLVVALEEYLGDVARRLRHFDADPERVHVVDRLPSDPRERPSALAAHVETVQPVLVIVDTLMSYARGLIEDENNAAQMQPVVQALTDLAHRHEVAVILVHHNNKAGTYRGSSAIGGAVDVLTEMTIPNESTDPTRRKLKCVGRLPVYGFEMRYDSLGYTLADGDGLPLIQRVLNVIRANQPISTNRLQDLVGGRKETVDAAIANLWQRRCITDEGDPQSGHRWVASAAAPASVS